MREDMDTGKQSSERLLRISIYEPPIAISLAPLQLESECMNGSVEGLTEDEEYDWDDD